MRALIVIARALIIYLSFQKEAQFQMGRLF